MLSFMRKRLLVPPKEDGQILFLSDSEGLLYPLEEKKVAVAHQPYFFNPGVSLKYLFLDRLPQKNRKLLFVDIDKVSIEAKVPVAEGSVYTRSFINSDDILRDFPAPPRKQFSRFFLSLEEAIKNGNFSHSKDVLSNMRIFKDIVLSQKKRFFKEILAESFLEFHGIEGDYCFISEIIDSKEFRRFFELIYIKDSLFREIFNQALDDYKKIFRFRFKNYPFPSLREGELPFWIEKNGKRIKCFKKDIDLTELKTIKILPRAAALTIFLRLYQCDLFIHGIGGANYEWIGDRIIELFFKKSLPIHITISGTFLMKGISERRFPYFFFSPGHIKEKLEEFVLSRKNIGSSVAT